MELSAVLMFDQWSRLEPGGSGFTSHGAVIGGLVWSGAVLVGSLFRSLRWVWVGETKERARS